MTETKTKPFDPAVDPFDIERVEGVTECGDTDTVAWREVTWYTTDYVRQRCTLTEMDGSLTLETEFPISAPTGTYPCLSVVSLPNLSHSTVLEIMRANGWRKHDD